MAYSYNGLGATDPMGGTDFSMGMSPPMAPLSTGGTGAPSTQAATSAAVASAPALPSGTAAPAGLGNAAAAAPMVNPVTGEVMNPTFFQKGGGFSVALGALQTLGNLWNSFQQVKIAKDTLNFQKEAYQTNLANTEKDYNTRLESDANYSYQVSGKSQGQADQYVRDHSL
jgi:hypothetical protein